MCWTGFLVSNLLVDDGQGSNPNPHQDPVTNTKKQAFVNIIFYCLNINVIIPKISGFMKDVGEYAALNINVDDKTQYIYIYFMINLTKLNTGYKNCYLWKFFDTRFQVYKRAKSI